MEPRPGPDGLLVPEDVDRALRYMKRHLALIQLRRALLDPEIDAAGVLALTERIEALQAASDA